MSEPGAWPGLWQHHEVRASELGRRFEDVVGPGVAVRDPEIIAGSVVDFTGRFRGSTSVVLRPSSTEEVAAIVARCAADGVALCPQGGNTGLVGGSVPMDGEVVLSLRHLEDLVVDGSTGQAEAGAGCRVEALQQAARRAGWAYGVDLASRGSATVGGTVATNAGGLRVLRYGDTRAQILGVEAVLGDGSVVSHLSGLWKDNTGYHLPSLLCGSEGTLGVVTKVRLRLVPDLPHRATALVAFESTEAAMAAAADLRRLSSVEALELMVRRTLETVCEVIGRRPPLEGEAFLLVESASEVDPSGALAEAVGGLDGVRGEAVARDGPRRAELWSFRERHTEAMNRLGVPHKLDITLPQRALASFVEEVPGLVGRVAPGAVVHTWGHAGDGNVHVNVLGVDPGDEAVDGAVLEAVAAAGGSISAEHGIGRAKAPWLHLNRTPAELAAFASLKGALDPAGILNPGVLLGPQTPAPPTAWRKAAERSR